MYGVILFILWNIFVFLIYGADKLFAVNKKKRIPEKVLITLALFMGGAGAIFGMSIFKHKTRKMKFKITVPLGFVISVTVMFLYLYKIKELPL